MKWITRALIVIVMIIGWLDIAVLNDSNKKLRQSYSAMLSMLVQEQEVCEERFLKSDPKTPIDIKFDL